jgi:ribosome biogenesis SPOUT family RNA methylase Rps3
MHCENVWFVGVNPALKIPEGLQKAQIKTESVSDWDEEMKRKVLLLDPNAEVELSPNDAESYEYLLFGGILGDIPSQDRTSFLRAMGFTTRHLGPIQMTTDTAVLVSQQVLENRLPLSEINYIDSPEIMLSKKESVIMEGFRYIVKDGKPILPPGMIQHLKETNNESLF